MPSENNNILEFNQYMNSDKMTYIIYPDTESLIKKQMDVQTIQKKGIPCGYSKSTIWVFDKLYIAEKIAPRSFVNL